MNVKRFVIALLAAAAVGLMVWPSPAAPAEASGPQLPLAGWFTGGAKFEESASPSGQSRAVINFALSCDPSERLKHLQVTWGRGNRFRLEDLEQNECFVLSDPVGTWMSGRGTGRYNGVPGARVQFIFIDIGEPGTEDRAGAAIFDADGSILLDVGGIPDGGNVHFHQE